MPAAAALLLCPSTRSIYHRPNELKRIPTDPRNTLWAAGSARKRLAIERSRESGMHQHALITVVHGARREMSWEIASES